jgi:Uma2 family endonuclease
MAFAQTQQQYTIEEYLSMERAAEERHEYLDGLVYAMAGEIPAHADICTNLVRELSVQVRGTSCRVRSKDTKIRSGPAPRQRRSRQELFSYPDLVVICGEPQYHDTYRDVVLNPTAIVAVLSPSTEAFDRGTKFLRYHTWNPTLTEYVLVSQEQPLVEHFSRQPDGSWSYYVYQALEQRLTIASIGCPLQLADVYERLVFPAEPLEDMPEARS